MNARGLGIRSQMRRFSLGHAIADELDIIVSNTLHFNRQKHDATVRLRKMLMAIERQL